MPRRVDVVDAEVVEEEGGEFGGHEDALEAGRICTRECQVSVPRQRPMWLVVWRRWTWTRAPGGESTEISGFRTRGSFRVPE